MINNGVDHVDDSQSDLSTLLPGSLDGDAQEPPGLSGLIASHNARAIEVD
jgi:hypothetical protein